MKKIITLVALMLTISLFAQDKFEDKTVEVSTEYVGTSKGVFHFKDVNTQNIISFMDVSEAIINEQQLNDINVVGRKFDLLYEITWEKVLINERKGEETKTSVFALSQNMILKKVRPSMIKVQSK